MNSKSLQAYDIILASASPRRQQFFKDLGLPFSIQLKPIEEIYPKTLIGSEITDYLAELKTTPFKAQLTNTSLLITSDTIVWHNNTALGKPNDKQDAFSMLKSLSGDTHQVISSVCFTTSTFKTTVNHSTKVTFKSFTDDELWYYINTFNPLDKAGAYGIQDWIGLIGVTKLEGSYFNVMGLPTHLVYKVLHNLPKP